MNRQLVIKRSIKIMASALLGLVGSVYAAHYSGVLRSINNDTSAIKTYAGNTYKKQVTMNSLLYNPASKTASSSTVIGALGAINSAIKDASDASVKSKTVIGAIDSLHTDNVKAWNNYLSLYAKNNYSSAGLDFLNNYHYKGLSSLQAITPESMTIGGEGGCFYSTAPIDSDNPQLIDLSAVAVRRKSASCIDNSAASFFYVSQIGDIPDTNTDINLKKLDVLLGDVQYKLNSNVSLDYGFDAIIKATTTKDDDSAMSVPQYVVSKVMATHVRPDLAGTKSTLGALSDAVSKPLQSGWARTISTASPPELLRTIASMLAVNNYLQYKRYRQMQNLEVLQAETVSRLIYLHKQGN